MKSKRLTQEQNGIATTGFLIFLFVMTVSSVATAAEITYDSGRRRDPFKPLEGISASKVRTATSFTVEGIIYDPPTNSLAIIGGETYKVGDALGSVTILEIRKDCVIIEEKIDEELDKAIEEEIQQRTLWIRDEEQL